MNQIYHIIISSQAFLIRSAPLGRKKDNSCFLFIFRSSLEQQVWATDKLKQDLTEANARNALLAKEVDERHLQIEQSTERKLR